MTTREPINLDEMPNYQRWLHIGPKDNFVNADMRAQGYGVRAAYREITFHRAAGTGELRVTMGAGTVYWKDEAAAKSWSNVHTCGGGIVSLTPEEARDVLVHEGWFLQATH